MPRGINTSQHPNRRVNRSQRTGNTQMSLELAQKLYGDINPHFPLGMKPISPQKEDVVKERMRNYGITRAEALGQIDKTKANHYPE